eukprot:6949498-Prymnesium_polylepis.1
MPRRKKVACGSAAMQWTVWWSGVLSPLPSTPARSTSVAMFCGSGSVLLAAQNPPTGCTEIETAGELGGRLSGSVDEPLSS